MWGGGEEDKGRSRKRRGGGQRFEMRTATWKEKPCPERQLNVTSMFTHWTHTHTHTSHCVCWLHNSVHPEMFLLPVCVRVCVIWLCILVRFYTPLSVSYPINCLRCFLHRVSKFVALQPRNSGNTMCAHSSRWLFLTISDWPDTLCFHSSLPPSAVDVTVYNVRPVVVVVWDGWESCWQTERWQGLVKDECGRYPAATENGNSKLQSLS